MIFEENVLNIYIMVYSGFVVHVLMKCISLQSPNHHTRRDQSLLIYTVRTQILESMPKSKENVIVKTKWGCQNNNNNKRQIKEKRQKKKIEDIRSQAEDNDLKFLKP